MHFSIYKYNSYWDKGELTICMEFIYAQAIKTSSNCKEADWESNNFCNVVLSLFLFKIIQGLSG